MTYRRDETTDAGRQPPRFITTLAEDAETVRAAQRLRYRVFHGASGAHDAPDPGGGVDEDAFDAHCEHLVVRDTHAGTVVGTYRILTAERARTAGGFYSETEFDCSRLRRLDARLVEVGRACVDPDYRGGGVIALLLGGLTRWVVANRYDYVMGCASIDLARGTAPAATLCRRLLAEHRAPAEWRVVPRVAFAIDDPPAHDASCDAGPRAGGGARLSVDGGARRSAGGGGAPPCDVEPPPLIKAYLRFGASVCGPPAHDREFRTADLLMLLPMAMMDRRFLARLLRDGDPSPKRRSSRWAA